MTSTTDFDHKKDLHSTSPQQAHYALPHESNGDDNDIHDRKFEGDGSVRTDDEELEQESGVSRIEALYLVFGKGWKLWLLWSSIGIMFYAYSLQSNTVYVYQQFATSAFSAHASIGAISVLTSILSGVAQPFIAKIADITSRPIALTGGLAFFCLGYIITAASNSVESVCAGQVIAAVGTTTIYFVMGLLTADITPLSWRGLVAGLTSTPFIVNAFIAAYITDGISANVGGWRWGYGMFTIIIPVCVAPALFVLFWGDRKARRVGAVSIAASDLKARQHAAQVGGTQSFFALAVHYWRRVDAFGLLQMGTAFTLILLPFSLATQADKGYRNPSLIAMFAVGGFLLCTFTLWEWRYAQYPLMPKRVLNRSVIASCIIDFMYFLSFYVPAGYYNSYIYVLKNEWSLKNYTLWGNTLTVALCLFSVLAGLLHRIFHRYKYVQIVGLSIRIVGMALQFVVANGNSSNAVIIMAPILCGLGGSFSVIGSQVATQGSVPHRDMGTAIALLALWTAVGGGVGNAIGAALWTDMLPKKLEQYAGYALNSTQLEEIYGSIVVAQFAEPREPIIRAYNETMWVMTLAGFILCFPSLAAGFLTSNFKLDDRHNNVEDKEVRMLDESEILKEPVRQ